MPRCRSYRLSPARAVIGLLVVAAPSVAAPAAVRAERDPVTAMIVAAQMRRDSMTVTIEPTKRVEVKLVMKKGQKAEFEWTTNGADVGFNMHGEIPTDPSIKAHVYQRGSSKAEKGTIIAAFDGIHGWSWRNTGDKPVTITVKASGQFSEMKKL